MGNAEEEDEEGVELVGQSRVRQMRNRVMRDLCIFVCYIYMWKNYALNYYRIINFISVLFSI